MRIALPLVLATLLAGAAHAQPCRDLATSHTDQRELDTLRGDVAASCGCAGAASRSAYRSCARGALRSAFSTGCFASPDCAPPATLTQDEAHAQVLRWLVPFLEVYVAGNESLRPLLAEPVPPGVTVETVL